MAGFIDGWSWNVADIKVCTIGLDLGADQPTKGERRRRRGVDHLHIEQHENMKLIMWNRKAS